MKAAVYHEFGGPIKIETVPYPECPKDDGIIVKVMATGICRSDWHGWKGHDEDVRRHGLPFVPGHEFSGIIVEVSPEQQQTNPGHRPRSLRAGDRVAVPFILSCGRCRFCRAGCATVCLDQQQPGFTRYGSFAQYVALPRAHRHCRILPSSSSPLPFLSSQESNKVAGVSFVQAAALGCRFTTAYRAIFHRGRFLERIERNKTKKKTRNPSHDGHQDDVEDDGDDDGDDSSRSFQIVNTMAVFGCGGLGLSCIMLAASAAAEAAEADSSSPPNQSRKAMPLPTPPKPKPAAQIIAVDISEAALRKASELGATHTVLVATTTTTTAGRDDDDDNNKNHVPVDDADIETRRRVLELTPNGDGVDLSLDAAGFPSTCENAVWCTKRAGRMVQVGLPLGGGNNNNNNNDHDQDDENEGHDQDDEEEEEEWPQREDDVTMTGRHRPGRWPPAPGQERRRRRTDRRRPDVPMDVVAGRELEIHGSHGFDPEDLSTLLRWVAEGRLDPSKLVERRVDLHEGCRVLEAMDRSSPLGMTVITDFLHDDEDEEEEEEDGNAPADGMSMVPTRRPHHRHRPRQSKL